MKGKGLFLGVSVALGTIVVVWAVFNLVSWLLVTEQTASKPLEVAQVDANTPSQAGPGAKAVAAPAAPAQGDARAPQVAPGTVPNQQDSKVGQASGDQAAPAADTAGSDPSDKAGVPPTCNCAPDFFSVVHSRKSVRKFLDTPVPKEALEKILKAGMAAPTAVDRRPWAFVAVTDRTVLDALAEKLPFAKMLYQAGAAIIVLGDLDKALPGEAQAYWIQDTSAVTQNILLAVEAMGLGAVWTGVYPNKDREATVRELLELPLNVIPLNVIPIGYPAGEQKAKDKWDSSIIHWEKW